MNVELPISGCNILRSDTSFYNYSPDSRTRSTYYIFDGQARLESTSTSQYGYTYSGTCLQTGDLVYKPEIEIYFRFMSLSLFIFILFLIYKIIFKRLLP